MSNGQEAPGSTFCGLGFRVQVLWLSHGITMFPEYKPKTWSPKPLCPYSLHIKVLVLKAEGGVDTYEYPYILRIYCFYLSCVPYIVIPLS